MTNFERDIEDKKIAIGVGRYANALRILAVKHWGPQGVLEDTKLKTGRKVLRRLTEDPTAYDGYDTNIYFQVGVEHMAKLFPDGGSHYPNWSTLGMVFPKDLAGMNIVYQNRLYTLVPLPPEE